MKKIFLLLIPVAVLLGSCRKECTCSNQASDTKEIEMRFSTYSAVTRAGSDDVIETVDILVFDGTGYDTDNATFIYSRYAWKKSSNVYTTVLKVGENLDIYFAINVREIIADKLTEGMTWSQAREALVMENPDRVGLTNGLPMWGCKLDQTITDGPLTNFGTIKLLRSVASVDVTVSASNFILGKGHIVFGADRGQLPFSVTNETLDGQNGMTGIQAPEIPAGMTATKEWSHNTAGTMYPNMITNVFYMFENDAPANDRRYTKVILEGRWIDSENTENTFYPLSLRDKATNAKIPLKRNTKFIIVVTNVNGDGYQSLDEAKDGEDVNMDYEVIPWDEYEDSDIMIDGTKYFSIPSKSVLMPRERDRTAILKFATNYDPGDIKLKLDDSDTGVGVIDTHPRFKVEVLTLDDAGGNPYNCFRITTKDVYGTENNPAHIIVMAGRIRFTLDITQLDRSAEDWEYGGDTGLDFGKN